MSYSREPVREGAPDRLCHRTGPRGFFIQWCGVAPSLLASRITNPKDLAPNLGTGPSCSIIHKALCCFGRSCPAR